MGRSFSTSPHLLPERFLLFESKPAAWVYIVMMTTPSSKFSLSRETGSAPVSAICFVELPMVSVPAGVLHNGKNHSLLFLQMTENRVKSLSEAMLIDCSEESWKYITIRVENSSKVPRVMAPSLEIPSQKPEGQRLEFTWMLALL